jgi:hypothetical protein
MRKGKWLVLASALGLVLAGPAWAQVKQGDLDLTFHTQVEIDFEYRSNYDFSEEVRGIQAVGATNGEDFFVFQESRFWMDAKAGAFDTRIMFELEQTWDTDEAEGDPANDLGLEQVYGGYDFGFVKMRAGLQVFQLDPAQIVYWDDDYGVRLWQTYGWGGWNFFWVFNQEGQQGPTTTLTADQDRHYFMGNLDHKLFGFTLTHFVGYVTDHSEPATTAVITGARSAAGAAVPINKQSLVWLGTAAQGQVFGINVLAQFTHVSGDQDFQSGPGVAVDFAGRNHVDVSAWAGFLNLAWPIPGTPLTLEFGGVWMSGDDDPNDEDANGYQGFFQDVELLAPQGVWLDDSITLAPKVNGQPQHCAGTTAANPAPSAGTSFTAACQRTFTLKSDDDWAPGQGDFNFDSTPGLLGGATVGNFDPNNPVAPGNFGLQYYHAAVHYKATPELTLSTMFSYIAAMQDDLLGGDTHVGNEISVQGQWKPHKYLTFTPTITWLIPGDAMENIVGEDDTAFGFVLEAMFLF